MEALDYLGKSCLQKADFPSRLRQKFRLTSCLSTSVLLETHIYKYTGFARRFPQIISRRLLELDRGKVLSIAAISSSVSLQFPTAPLISFMWSGLPAFGIVKRAG